VEIVPLNLSLLDLEPGNCRWPFGNGPFLFCGHPSMEGSKYCTPHFYLSIGPGTTSERIATKGIGVAA
jgi:GcrA cell cycle regulator